MTLRRIVLDGVIGLLLVAVLVYGVMRVGASRTGAEASAFASKVDLTPIGQLAVMTEGRIKSLDSLASGTMQMISGPRKVAGQSPTFTYLDMMLRRDAYRDADVVYIKNKQVRQAIAEALSKASPEFASRMPTLEKLGLIAPRLLEQPVLQPLMERLASDLIRTSRTVSEIENAQGLMRSDVLMSRLRVIPVAPDANLEAASDRSVGGESKPPVWRSLQDVWPIADGTGQLRGAPPIPRLDPAAQRAISDAWVNFAVAWYAQDPDQVHAAAAQLASAVKQADTAAMYPTESRLAWESWYFKARGLTWIWLLYIAAVILLSMAFVYRWRWARASGLGMFLIAFGFHTFALVLRWYVSGRWPNSNMFEAVTTSAWFGGVGALLLEVLARRTALRSLFALGSAVASMVAMMAAYFLPLQLNPQISNMMPVLHDVWLYIHTNVIIFSYVLIFMAAVTAMFYLRHRALGGARDFARVGGAGMLMTASGEPEDVPPTRDAIQAAMGAAAREELEGVRGASVFGTTAAAPPRRASIGEVLDGATMVLMELSFILLWAGIIMGAIWADHSWGRPWGWDPKEVFALNTFIVFAVLVHVRLKVADKGLWTALLAIIGAGVMLFNWIVINFVISGLHSYA
jgi:cytochrome c-type biogenesis protein CcsB